MLVHAAWRRSKGHNRTHKTSAAVHTLPLHGMNVEYKGDNNVQDSHVQDTVAQSTVGTKNIKCSNSRGLTLSNRFDQLRSLEQLAGNNAKNMEGRLEEYTSSTQIARLFPRDADNII